MTCEEKIWELRQIIEEQLTPLINNDYVLYDLPYYSNIGDLLIWEGELSFLKVCICACLCAHTQI